MISNKQLEILASFFPNLEEKTSKELETSTGFSHEPTFRILKSLVKNKYLNEKKVGKTNVYNFILKDDSIFVYNYFMTKKINKFKEKNYLLFKRLKEFINSVENICTILFGSYAKGVENKRSDIDILIVSNKKNIEKIAMSFKTKYNISINPIVIKPNDFKNIKTDNKTFYNDIVSFGVILYGTEFFFREVYENVKIN